MEGIPQIDSISPENTEALKKSRFYYANNDLPGRPIIFECCADTITEADAMFERKFNIKVEDSYHIGCSVVKNSQKVLKNE